MNNQLERLLSSLDSCKVEPLLYPIGAALLTLCNYSSGTIHSTTLIKRQSVRKSLPCLSPVVPLLTRWNSHSLVHNHRYRFPLQDDVLRRSNGSPPIVGYSGTRTIQKFDSFLHSGFERSSSSLRYHQCVLDLHSQSLAYQSLIEVEARLRRPSIIHEHFEMG